MYLNTMYLNTAQLCTYCPLVVSFVGRNLSFLPQHRSKNVQSHGCHSSNFPFFEL